MWEQLHTEIIEASRAIAEAGKFDDAIFAAFRLVEATIQDRIVSTQIGEALIREAFEGTPPRINISSDTRDQVGVRNLFSGALSNIRNDRGHKKAPLTPCESVNDCILYLGFASFLLYLLAKDKNTFPRIDSVRLLSTSEEPRAELRGSNFAGAQVVARAEGARAIVVRQEPNALEILLPKHFFGNVSVLVDGKPSGEIFCDAGSLGKQPESYYEAIAAEVTLYSDAKASKKRSDVVGLLLRSNEGAREFLRIVPTRPNCCKAGFYVTHGPYDPHTSVGETWYVDPSTGKIEYAWTGSLVTAPKIVGPVGIFKLGGISILPKSVHTQLGENRCLRVSGWGRDGSVRKEFDLTDQGKWKNLNPAIAFVQGGVVTPKRLGKTRVECEVEGFVDSVEISVEHLLNGQRATYFQGLWRLQQIRFDREDNLYICNQGASVFRLDKAGAFEEVVRISTSSHAAAGIDCLAIDADKNLYVNDVSKHSAFKFTWDGKGYTNPVEIASTVTGAKKGFAITDSGEVFIAVMGPPNQGWIVRRKTNGKETSFPVDGMPIWIAAGPDGNIYVPIGATSTVVAYRPDGTIVDRIPFEIKESSLSDILVDKNGTIYLALFHTGKILRIGFVSPLWRAELLEPSFGTPGGIAMDSRGRLYVSDFAGNSIDVIY
jgi:sugar lactone lactonase YvrE